MEETFVVDRIEEGIAICENQRNKTIIEIRASKLPKGVKEGDVIKYFDGIYRIDIEEQENIKKRIEKKMNSLWE